MKKFSPETECKKVPFELCGPGACPVEQGPEECQDRMETVSGFLYLFNLLLFKNLSCRPNCSNFISAFIINVFLDCPRRPRGEL